MNKTIGLLALVLIIYACSGEETDKYPTKQANWESRKSGVENFDNYILGKTYLPVYSHIYHVQENRTFDLTITVSIRNISTTDTAYILKADYYNTIGEDIREYIKSPIYVKPLETLEIIIAEKDIAGGSGANFIFNWAMTNDKNPPLFEAVMISSYGQQGISFLTRGIRIFD